MWPGAEDMLPRQSLQTRAQGETKENEDHPSRVQVSLGQVYSAVQ